MDKASILTVDDDPAINNLLADVFEMEGWETRTALTGEKALELFDEKVPDLTVLDIGLPGIDGFEVCKEIAKRSANPVIMLSARDDAEDKIKCLKMGADDYLSKPFRTDELVARMKAVFRRYQKKVGLPNKYFEKAGIMINFRSRQVKAGGQQIKLTRIEYSLLQELALNAGNVLEDKDLISKVWGPQYGDERQYLYVHINHLRSKIEPDPQNPRYIVTVQGTGYMFRDAD